MAKRSTKRAEKRDPVVWAYMRVSTEEQSLEGQENQILKWANERGVTVRRFFSVKMSSTKSERTRQIEELKAAAQAGEFNTLVCAELSRLGRGSSLGEIPRLVDFFHEHCITLHFIREGIDTSRDDINTLVTLSLFSLMAQVERRLISERTKAGLAASRAKGRVGGRPAGVSKLDAFEDEIRQLVQDLSVPIFKLAERYEVNRMTMSRFVKRKRPEWLALGTSA